MEPLGKGMVNTGYISFFFLEEVVKIKGRRILFLCARYAVMLSFRQSKGRFEVIGGRELLDR